MKDLVKDGWTQSSITRILLILAVANLISACATYNGTGYRPRGPEGTEGYAIKEIEGGGYNASYVGNAMTSGSDAVAYVMLAAYSYCADAQKVAVVGKPEDLSVTSNYLATGITTVPVYNSNGTTSYTTQNYVYPTSRTYPAFVSGFLCRKHYRQFDAKLELEAIGRELVHPTTKDFKGGLLIKSSDVNLFRLNDVIIRVAGTRVETNLELSNALEVILENAKTVSVDVIRSERIVKLKSGITDFTAGAASLADSTINMLCGHLPKGMIDEGVPARPDICAQSAKANP